MLDLLWLLSNELFVKADEAITSSDDTVVFPVTLDPAQIETRELQ